MERQAQLAIGDAFDNTTEPIRTFNVLIETLTDEAEHHLSRDRLIRLLLNEVAAQSGRGRSESRGRPRVPSQNPAVYAAVNAQAQAAKRMTRAIGDSR